MKKPVEIACRACAAQPLVFCVKRDGVIERYMLDGFHPERVEDAGAEGEPVSAHEQALVDEAIADVAGRMF